MSEDVKRIAVTFGTGLPLGERAIFRHDGRMWVAYPAKKNERILAVIDRMIGIYSKMAQDMLIWLNSHPEDAERVVFLAGQVRRAQNLQKQLVEEKISAVTS